MERATDLKSIEEAERLLKRYTDSLSFDSISIFKENSSLLYSSDPELQQQDGTESLFEALDGFYYAFEIEEINSIIVYDSSNCLIIIPLYLGDWGIVEGWLFVLGSREKIDCKDLVDQLKIQVEKLQKKDISAELKIERHENKLRRAFEFPNILGREFEFDVDTKVVIDGQKGFIMQTYGESPWGITTRSPRRKYPEPLIHLYDDLILEIEQFAIGVPEQESMETEIQEILDSDGKPRGRTGPDYSGSNKMLLIILVYNLYMAFALTILDVTSPNSGIFLLIGINMSMFLLIGLVRISVKSNPCISCMIFLIGVLAVLGGISMILVNFVGSMTAILIGIYFLMMGVLAYVTRKERMRM